MIKTNIGEMPLEDYLEIKALQYGYDSYKDMLDDKLIIEIEAENAKIKTPSPKHKLQK